ncbi:MAG: hypothetical protein K2X11_17635, partial [Acetobacteraceae bacterium]|nr:hypothetical protein [Acetobacteraceae bacterium]
PPVPPPPEPSRQAGTGQTPPVQRPEERSQSVLNTLERLRAQQQQQQPPTARPNPAQGAPQQGGGAPQGTASLSASERAGLADKISECWSVDAGAPGLNQIVVELRIEVDAQGVVRVVRPNGAVPADPRARMVFESARRALLDPRCNPLPLPRERLAALRDAVFRFRPSDLGLR